MPTYEFKCPKCEHVWDDFQSIKLDKHVSDCPKCNEKDIPSRISGGCGFMFTDQHGNPVSGFPTNDMKKEREQRDTVKDLDNTLPKLPPGAAERAHAKIRAAGKKKG